MNIKFNKLNYPVMKKFDIDKAIAILSKRVKELKTPIVDLVKAQTNEPWKVLVATILSARTTDSTTSQAVSKLFKRVNNIDDLSRMPVSRIEKLIYPVGFYRNKAKFLKKLPGELKKLFKGRIPDSVEELIRLPGVGRKTANLVVSVGFNRPAVCVDTHVHRIMNIWGYVKTKNPLETEMALRKKLDKKYWISINSILVAYGQSICRPVSPRCNECDIEFLCPQTGVTPRKIKKKTSSNKNNLSLISWNVNGIRASVKKGFIDFVKDSKADIIAVQETKAQPEQLSEEIINIPGYTSYWFSAKRKGYSGVGIFSKLKPISIINGINKKEFDDEGRALTLEYETFYFVNCYFPNSQHELLRLDYKLRFNEAILKYCRKLSRKKSVIICGDFNVAHKAIDLKNPKSNEQNPGYSLPERNSMDKFIDSGFIDTFRMFNKGPDNYTWWSYRFNARERNIGWRIDYFCVDKKSESRVVNAEILPDITGSDHCPVSLEWK